MTDVPPLEEPDSSAAKVAVIVVSGVGDDTLGSGRDAIAATFVDDPDGRWEPEPTKATTRLIATADSGEHARDGGPLVTGKGSPNLREPFDVPTAQITGRGGATSIDVYEMYWADLSRAQGPVQRLFYLLFAITMQVSTIGLEAVRQFDGEIGAGGRRVRRGLERTLNAMSYWLVYAITPLVLAMVALAVTVNLELLTRAKDTTSWVLIALLGVGAGAAGWWIGGRVYRGGWTFDTPNDPWAYRERDPSRPSPWPLRTQLIATVTFVAAAIWVGTGVTTDLAIQVAFLIGVCACAVVFAVRLADRPPQPDPVEDHASRLKVRRHVRMVVQAAYASIPMGAMLLVALNEPRGGGAGVRAANALTMIAGGAFRGTWLVMLSLCSLCVVLALWMRLRAGKATAAATAATETATETDPKKKDDPRRTLSATVMLSVMLGPVLYALATSATFLLFAAAWRVYPASAKQWPAEHPRCPGDTIIEPIADCPKGTTNASTADWGTDLVRAVVQPLGLALLLVAVLLTAFGWFFREYVGTFRARNATASAVDISIKQGRAFTNALKSSGRDPVFIGCVGIVLLTTLVGAVIWLDGRQPVQDVGGFLSSVAFPMAYGIAILAIAGVGLRNVGFASRLGGGFLRILALVLDTIYDVTTYLRVANPAIVAPRVRMVARARAVLKHARAKGYDHVVVMAHSQGTVLSLATLLGDQHRAPRVTPPAADDLPPTLTFLSYGSPVTQTYAKRFPGQFADWKDRAVATGSPIRSWLNVYRAGDYIGRWIGTPALSGTDTPDRAPIRERCLGPGHHTGYLTDERWRRVARHVVTTAPGEVRLADVSLADLTVAVLDRSPESPSSEDIEPSEAD